MAKSGRPEDNILRTLQLSSTVT